MAIENLQKHLLLALLICSFLIVVLKNVNEKEKKENLAYCTPWLVTVR